MAESVVQSQAWEFLALAGVGSGTFSRPSVAQALALPQS